MKRTLHILLLTASLTILSHTASAQIDWGRALSAVAKVFQASTISDSQVKGYVKEFITKSDQQNHVCDSLDPYSVRLNKIMGTIVADKELNIKVYPIKEPNAFACADGSIRVYSGLMDIMSDDEILGVVGHEIGHIKNKDTKDAFRTALLNSALLDGIASTGKTAARLTDSQLGNLSSALVNSRYSQKQEYAADKYGYEFLKSHGKNPWAMALSFEKLQKMQQQMGANKASKVQQLFSTHPDIEARTKKMAERAAAEGFARPTE